MPDTMILVPLVSLALPGLVAFVLGRRLNSLWPGLVLGAVDSIKRQGNYEGITATPSAPVVVVAGKAYRAADVRVVMEA